MSECILCKEGAVCLNHELEQSVIEMIKKSNSEWVETDGACPKCEEYYAGLDEMVKIE